MTRLANESRILSGADLAQPRSTPRLLVSVRNLAEAEAALVGGADWIDLKEPAQGPLGAPAPEVAQRTVAALAGRVPWSAAAGELRAWDGTADDMLCDAPPGYVLKLGLAGCGVDPRWTARWSTADAACRARGARLAAVSYADWQAAQAPPWEEVAAFAIEAGASYWLIDTFDKRAGGLFAHVSPAALSRWARRVRAAGLAVAVAGSLTSADVPQLPLRDTDLVAIRTAACAPDRWGTVDAGRVRAFRAALLEACRAAGVAGSD
jgi:uncharacterized protein (UPF0264 family)